MTSVRIEGFELSPQQRRLWALHGAQGGTAYRAQCTVRLRGNLDIERLRKAIAALAARHEILRTSFYATHEMSVPVQVVNNEANVDLKVIDLSNLSGGEQRDAVSRLVREAGRRSYDFARVPLATAFLATLSGSAHVLHLDLPAICCDAAGLTSAVREIAAIYDPPPSGDASDEPLQYVDASIWLNEALTSSEAAVGRQFWQQADVSAMSRQRLPFERSQAARRFEPRRVSLNVPAGFAASVNSIFPAGSLLAFLLAAAHAILQRTIGDRQVTTGFVWDGRGFAELEHAIGPFTRSLPLAGGGDSSFAELVSHFQKATAEARKWGHCFDWSLLSQAAGPASQEQLVPFVVECDDPSTLDQHAGGPEFLVEACSAQSDRFKMKIGCRAGSSVDDVDAFLEYDASLYEESDVRRFAGQLSVLIVDALQRPRCAVAELRLLSDAEERELVARSRPYDETISAPDCVHRLFEQQAALTPDAIAVVCDADRLTYAELNSRANQLAAHLRSLGVRPDDLVGLCLERSVDLIVGVLGILKAGGGYVPLDPALPAARLSAILEDSRAALVITKEHLRGTLPGSVGAVLLDADRASIESQSPHDAASGVRPEHLAYVLFTSGSTGRPKGVGVEHRQLVHYVHAIRRELDVHQSASFATVTTFAADLGNTSIFPSLIGGGCLHILSELSASDPDAFGDYFEHHGIDVLKIVPSHLKALLSASDSGRNLPRTHLVLGGEACPWELVEEVNRLKPELAVFNHYGPTETTVGATIYRVADRTMSEWAATVPIGRPLGNAAIHVLDRFRRPVPCWVAGELYIGGAGVSRGYLNAAASTEGKFIADPFSSNPADRLYRTGDVVRLLPTGDVEFLGRTDDQVKIRGFRIELGEIEATLRRWSPVGDAVVLVRNGVTQGDQRLIGFVTAQNGSRVDSSEAIATLKGALPDYMVPSAIVVLDRLPLNANGKIDRSALLKLADTAERPVSAAEQPSTSWESVVTGIWREYLETDEIGVHDNFYDLGGHSLMAIQVVTALEKRTGVHVSPRDLVFHTLRQFAAFCESRQPTAQN